MLTASSRMSEDDEPFSMAWMRDVKLGRKPPGKTEGEQQMHAACQRPKASMKLRSEERLTLHAVRQE